MRGSESDDQTAPRTAGGEQFLSPGSVLGWEGPRYPQRESARGDEAPQLLERGMIFEVRAYKHPLDRDAALRRTDPARPAAHARRTVSPFIGSVAAVSRLVPSGTRATDAEGTTTCSA